MDVNCIIHSVTGEPYTALHTAVIRNDLELLKFLIPAGADPNKLYDSIPSLSLAMLKGNIPMIKIIIQAGADINYQNSEGRTLLLQAIQNNNTQVVALLLKRGADLNHQVYKGVGLLKFSAFKNLGIFCFEPDTMVDYQNSPNFKMKTKYYDIKKDDQKMFSFITDVVDLLEGQTPSSDQKCSICKVRGLI